MATLVVDGDNLLTIGFYGVKNCFYKGTHIGGIFHFLNTLRRFIDEHHVDKIVVFWDGLNGSKSRKMVYDQYKENRKNKPKSEEEENSYRYQRERIKQYLEELFIRQGEYEECESDDGIAFYVQNSKGEKKIIFSSDGDLTQLVSPETTYYNPIHRIFYKPKDPIQFEHHTILVDNVYLVKMLCNDHSDNIPGIKGLGIKKIIELFPEIQTQVLTLGYIRNKTNYLFEQNSENKLLQNLITGTTKRGVLGEEFYETNNKLVNLTNPILTEEAKENILLLFNDVLDPEGRSYKNTMKMMMGDGIFNVIPKSEDAWLRFLTPFLKLTRKEKNNNLLKDRNKRLAIK
jgi:5'-3' exonuclease